MFYLEAETQDQTQVGAERFKPKLQKVTSYKVVVDCDVINAGKITALMVRYTLYTYREVVEMRTPMEQAIFLDFYKNTILCGSNNYQRFICNKLESENRISFDNQRKMSDKENTLFFESKKDLKSIISKITTTPSFMAFFEELEYEKLYKYSIPLFFEEVEKGIVESLQECGIELFDKTNYTPDYAIDRDLYEAVPIAYCVDDKVFIKFVLQKAYLHSETFEQIDYRYPIVIYIDKTINVLEIRYDAMRYSYNEQVDRDAYTKIASFCIEWIKKNLHLRLFTCGHTDTITIINDIQNTEVRMYKQMMEMKSGGSAELTASENGDYLLPFIGEIRELIDENEELFSESEEIRQLLLQYLTEKEATASYPYIYVKWVKPVETRSYIVKITFDYFSGKYTLLQHITGSCKDSGMGRMNDAIEYLSKSGSFVKGEEIKY